MEKPECSSWGCWLGKEVEGYDSRDELTLFVRRLPPKIALEELFTSNVVRLHKVKRVWFCEEFIEETLRWDFLEIAAQHF